MTLKEAQDKLNEVVKKVNLVCNDGKPPKDSEVVFCEYLLKPSQLVFISDLNMAFWISKMGACVTFREVQETDDLESLVFERSQITLGHLMDRVEGYLDRLNKLTPR